MLRILRIDFGAEVVGVTLVLSSGVLDESKNFFRPLVEVY
jgi:hypothetical protein